MSTLKGLFFWPDCPRYYHCINTSLIVAVSAYELKPFVSNDVGNRNFWTLLQTIGRGGGRKSFCGARPFRVWRLWWACRSLAHGRPRPPAGLRGRPAGPSSAGLVVVGAWLPPVPSGWAPWPVGAPAPPFRPPACPLVFPWRGALRAPGGLLRPS